MFFVISKALAFLLKPLNWTVLLAMFALFTKSQSRRKRYVWASLVVLLFFTNPLIVNYLCSQYEAPPRSPDSLPGTFEVGILLGGFTHQDALAVPGSPVFHRSGNRLAETLALYHSGKIRRILLVAGSGRVAGEVPPEADEVYPFLLRAGVPDSAIWLEKKSRNTRENAVFAQQMLDSLAPNASKLLITSGYHMPRAVACFRKAGLDAETYPTDFLTEKSDGNWLKWLEPSWQSLMKWNHLIKEWTGVAAYKFKGYI